jgi:hypothetical protein
MQRRGFTRQMKRSVYQPDNEDDETTSILVNVERVNERARYRRGLT